ncbi:MAG: superoxide dismutase, partial [Xanthobacteraceae bacterium]
LEPNIDALTMQIHHDKHHAAYVNALNEIAQKVPELGTTPIEKTLVDPAYIPLQVQQQVKNNLGGHWNHSFFWDLMTPGGGKEPTGDVKSAIEQFGGLSGLIEKINAAGAGRFGSGWAWLVVNKSKKLEILSTANQDSPIIEGNKAVLGVDVWEHAYYLKYQNRRPDYLKAWWNTVNWDKVSANLKKASA